MGLGDALLAELVGLGLGVAARGSLDALPAGPDVAVGRHARTIPLCDGPAQRESVSSVTVTLWGVYMTLPGWVRLGKGASG